MTQPTNPAGPYQMPSAAPGAAPGAAPTGKSVSSAGYWIGGGILIVGCGIAIVWFIVAIVGLVDAPNDFERLAIPGREVMTLDDGDWMIYYESNSSSGFASGVPSVDVTDPNGRSISVQYPSSTYTYDINGTSGEALYEFRAATPGAYTIEVSTVGEPALRRGDRIAIGRPLFDSSQVGSILGSLALGAISFLVGLVVLIVTIVRRSRAKRRPAMAYGGPAYGAPYGPQHYGGPPYAGPSTPMPGRPPDPAGWLPPQAPPWGAPPAGPQPPPAGPATWPPPSPPPPSSPTSPREGPPPAPPETPTSPWTPPGTSEAPRPDEPDDDTPPT